MPGELKPSLVFTVGLHDVHQAVGPRHYRAPEAGIGTADPAPLTFDIEGVATRIARRLGDAVQEGGVVAVRLRAGAGGGDAGGRDALYHCSH